MMATGEVVLWRRTLKVLSVLEITGKGPSYVGVKLALIESFLTYTCVHSYKDLGMCTEVDCSTRVSIGLQLLANYLIDKTKFSGKAILG